MSKPAKSTKKKKKSVSIHLRVSKGAAEWLESETDDEKITRQDVARAILEEKRRAAQKPPTGG